MLRPMRPTFNPNTDKEQVATLLDLNQMLEAIKDLSDNGIVLACNFIFFSIHP